MLSFRTFFLVTSTVEALVLTPVSNISPTMAQSSAGDNASLETVSSALLDSPSFITTTSSLSIANSSLASNNSLSAQTVIMCKGASMGYELDARSCGYAIGTIQHHLAREFTWGPRGTEIRYDFPMPRRWVSCGLLTATLPVLSKSVQLTRSVADGTCVIQTRVLPGYTSAEASLQDVALGAIAVMTECVQKKTPSEGGLAKNIGQCLLLLSIRLRADTHQAATTSSDSLWRNHMKQPKMCAVMAMLPQWLSWILARILWTRWMSVILREFSE